MSKIQIYDKATCCSTGVCGPQVPEATPVHEVPYISEVIEQRFARTVIISWQAEPPTGRKGLSRLAATATNSIAERSS